jgi:hypothetical protein
MTVPGSLVDSVVTRLLACTVVLSMYFNRFRLIACEADDRSARLEPGSAWRET